MRRLVLSLFLLLSSTVSAHEFRFDPPNPTSSTPVRLEVDGMWPDSCAPDFERVSFDSNNEITVIFVYEGGQCLAAFSPWRETVNLGVREPGVYTVRVLIENHWGAKPYATLRLIVAEGDPAFQVTPSFVSTQGGSVNLSGPLLCVASPQQVRDVRVNGIPVPYAVDPCSIAIIQTPALAPGAADVSVQIGDAVYRVRSTLRVVDPQATPDEAVFERVLIPVLFNGPGAFGSVWRTMLELRNLSDRRLTFLPAVMKDTPSVPLLGKSTLDRFGGPKGAVIFLPREIADDIKFGLQVRDVSREAIAWATEVRVVRERDASRKPMMLANVPFDGSYRLTLRLYSLDGGAARLNVVSADAPFVHRAVELEAACAAPPCNSTEPGYAAVDLNALLPELANKGARTLYVETPADGRLYWAFVSITNNTTQVVTTVSPQ
jgi:hypothetical protein